MTELKESLVLLLDHLFNIGANGVQDITYVHLHCNLKKYSNFKRYFAGVA
jgi:hypothetical protein